MQQSEREDIIQMLLHVPAPVQAPAGVDRPWEVARMSSPYSIRLVI